MQMGPGFLAHAPGVTRNEMLLSLLSRMAKGDERALADLYDETSAVIHGLVVKILRDVSTADGLRREREALTDTLDGVPATMTDPAESTLADESRRAVRAALDALPAEQRRTLELAYYTGMSHREIADALNLPLGTVKTRIRRAMIVMRGTLHPWLSETTARRISW
jgi:RNA polymerase sigma-70 factor, ECF subfamily